MRAIFDFPASLTMPAANCYGRRDGARLRLLRFAEGRDRRWHLDTADVIAKLAEIRKQIAPSDRRGFCIRDAAGAQVTPRMPMPWLSAAVSSGKSRRTADQARRGRAGWRPTSYIDAVARRAA
jgi:hypothetical protein